MKISFSKLIKLSLSQTAKDTYWVFAANIFTSFLAFVYTIFLARSFTPSDFGIFSAILAFTLLSSDVADLGISTALSRFLPPFYTQKEELKANAFIKTSFFFQLKIALILFILTIIFSSTLSQLIFNRTNFFPYFILSGFGIVGIIVFTFSVNVLSAQKKFKAVAILNSLSTIAKVVPIILLSIIGKLTVYTTIFAFMISAFVAYFFSFGFLSFKFLSVVEAKGTLQKILSYSVYLATARLFSAIGSRLDVLMLIPLSSSFEAGIYSAAYKIAFIYILLSSSFSMVIAPRLSSFVKLDEAIIYLRKVMIAVVGILMTMVVMYFIAPWFVVFVLGKAYIDSIPVFQALLLPMAFFAMTIPPVNFLLYTLKKPQVSTFNTFIQLFIILFGNLVFIPKFGRFGPTITLSVVYAFTFISASIFSVYYLRKAKHE